MRLRAPTADHLVFLVRKRVGARGTLVGRPAPHLDAGIRRDAGVEHQAIPHALQLAAVEHRRDQLAAVAVARARLLHDRHPAQAGKPAVVAGDAADLRQRPSAEAAQRKELDGPVQAERLRVWAEREGECLVARSRRDEELGGWKSGGADCRACQHEVVRQPVEPDRRRDIDAVAVAQQAEHARASGRAIAVENEHAVRERLDGDCIDRRIGRRPQIDAGRERGRGLRAGRAGDRLEHIDLRRRQRRLALRATDHREPAVELP